MAEQVVGPPRRPTIRDVAKWVACDMPVAVVGAQAEGLARADVVRADAVVDAALLARAPRLRVLARTGVGVDLVDLWRPAGSPKPVPRPCICNARCG